MHTDMETQFVCFKCLNKDKLKKKNIVNVKLKALDIHCMISIDRISKKINLLGWQTLAGKTLTKSDEVALRGGIERLAPKMKNFNFNFNQFWRSCSERRDWKTGAKNEN